MDKNKAMLMIQYKERGVRSSSINVRNKIPCPDKDKRQGKGKE